MDLHSLEQALSGLPFNWIRYFERTGSTNDDARRWAEEGAPDLALVAAGEQTAGRGRLERGWFTPPNAALAFSLVLRENGEQSAQLPQVLGRLPALGALAVSQALHSETGLEAQIKWPNDVLLQGRKVCGILAEALWQGERLSAVILGIGLNLSQASVPPASDLLFPATCVEAELGRPVEREDLLRSILEHLLVWRERLGADEFLDAWESRLAYRGQWVRVSSGRPDEPAGFQEGQILGLETDGALRLQGRDGGSFTTRAGDVSLRKLP